MTKKDRRKETPLKMKPEVYILCGNVGTGKTTYRNELIETLSPNKYVIINNDNILLSFNGIYPINYREFHANLLKAMRELLYREWSYEANRCYMCNEKPPFLIIDNMNHYSSLREELIKKVRALCNDSVKITIVNFGKGDEISLKRRIEDSRDLSEERWVEVFNKVQKEWQEPNEKEGYDFIINMKNKMKKK